MPFNNHAGGNGFVSEPREVAEDEGSRTTRPRGGRTRDFSGGRHGAATSRAADQKPHGGRRRHRRTDPRLLQDRLRLSTTTERTAVGDVQENGSSSALATQHRLTSNGSTAGPSTEKRFSRRQPTRQGGASHRTCLTSRSEPVRERTGRTAGPCDVEARIAHGCSHREGASRDQADQ